MDTIELDTSGQYNTFIRCVVAADVDQDGSPDLIASDRFDDELLVLVNDGTGGFLPPLAFEATGGEWNRIVIAEDLNGDGFPDLAISSLQGLVVMLNRGLGESTFWLGFDGPVLHAPGIRWVDAVDLDGDGDPDLLVADLGLAGEETGFHYFMNDGAGQFSEVLVNLDSTPAASPSSERIWTATTTPRSWWETGPAPTWSMSSTTRTGSR